MSSVSESFAMALQLKKIIFETDSSKKKKTIRGGSTFSRESKEEPAKERKAHARLYRERHNAGYTEAGLAAFLRQVA